MILSLNVVERILNFSQSELTILQDLTFVFLLLMFFIVVTHVPQKSAVFTYIRQRCLFVALILI